jgi:transcriptional regulator with GAF, ATPase, and Fis domain
MSADSLSERMAAVARELQDQHDPVSTVQSGVELAVQNVGGCDAASVSIVHARRKVSTPASTDDMAVIGDRLQYETGEGPCLSAIWEEETVYVPDLAHDPRWLHWGPRLSEATGVLSSFSVRLFTIKDTLGALNMYATKAAAFSVEDKAEGVAIAAHIAVAVAAAQNLEHFETALDSRTIIAQACGLVMERFDIDSIQAFALLTRLSQNQNVKLRDVATELVLTRRLPRNTGDDL